MILCVSFNPEWDGLWLFDVCWAFSFYAVSGPVEGSRTLTLILLYRRNELSLSPSYGDDSMTSYLPLAIWNCPSNGVVFNPLIHSPTMSFFNALFRSTRQCFFCINICEYFSSWTPSLTLQISSIDSFWLIMINYCFVDLFLYCIWGAGECVSALDIERGENEWWWWGWSFIVLDWKFSQVFGEGSAGEEVQEGILSLIYFPVFFFASLSVSTLTPPASNWFEISF